MKRQTTMGLMVFGVLIGLAAGIGGFTFVYAKGFSYLTNAPEACANCHVMRDYYAAYQKSSHHSVAVCNDCHTPPEFVGKYLTKGLNGFHHSYAFTAQNFQDALRITPRNEKIAETACRHCHADIVEAMVGSTAESKNVSCIRCHGAVGHQRRN